MKVCFIPPIPPSIFAAFLLGLRVLNRFWKSSWLRIVTGITSGLRGGKLIFDNDDLTAFEHTHPTFRGAGDSGLAMTAQPTPDRLSYKVSGLKLPLYSEPALMPPLLCLPSFPDQSINQCPPH